jgi:hypothetical protein
MAAGLLVQHHGRFEGRTGELELDAAGGMAQVQQARRALALLQQTQQAATQRSSTARTFPGAGSAGGALGTMPTGIAALAPNLTI